MIFLSRRLWFCVVPVEKIEVRIKNLGISDRCLHRRKANAANKNRRRKQ